MTGGVFHLGSLKIGFDVGALCYTPGSSAHSGTVVLNQKIGVIV